MTDQSGNNRFATPDTALAAWLYSQGFELLDVESGTPSSFFIFSSENPHLADYVRDFECGRAVGSVLTFYLAYKKMLTKVKVGQL